mgnify:CR=1 FL=1
MATERNPFEQKPIDAPNVIPIQQEDTDISFELDSEGGVVVNFGEAEIQEELNNENPADPTQILTKYITKDNLDFFNPVDIETSDFSVKEM